MAHPLVLINVVGLTHEMLGPNTPNISRVAADGFTIPMGTVLPAVTCSAQATLLTGSLPREHGIVANGWYWRDLAEVLFWRQSNQLVRGERLYDAARKRDPSYSVAKLFWWFNMYADVNWSVTPRPSYPADGRKVLDSYSQPADLKDRLQERLGISTGDMAARTVTLAEGADSLKAIQARADVLGGEAGGSTLPAALHALADAIGRVRCERS